jgi:hypothetical protein
MTITFLAAFDLASGAASWKQIPHGRFPQREVTGLRVGSSDVAIEMWRLARLIAPDQGRISMQHLHLARVGRLVWVEPNS